MSFDPYLHFQGNCAEAMASYQRWFGGDLFVMHYRDAPPEAQPPGLDAAGGALVMHAALTVGGRVLMASDFPPGWGEAQAAVSLSHAPGTRAQAKAIFDTILGDGGAVVMDWTDDIFFAEGFGMVKDRFGTHWMITGPGKQ